MSNLTELPAKGRSLPALLRVGLAFVISGALIAWLLSKVDRELARESLSSLEPTWIGAAALCSSALLFFRGFRFAALSERAPAPVAFASIAVQVFLNRIMPMRLGEFSLPYLLQQHGGEDSARTLLRLLLVRLIDLLVVVAAVVLALSLRLGGEGAPSLWAPALALAALLPLLLSFRFWLRLGVKCGAWLVLQSPLARLAPLRRILDRLEAAAADPQIFGPRRIGLALSSLGVFAAQTALFSALLRAFGVQLPLSGLLFGGAVAQAGGAVPVPSVGTIGPQEAAWVAGYTWVGVSFDEAVLTAVAAQLITLAFSACFALPAWLWLERRAASRLAEETG